MQNWLVGIGRGPCQRLYSCPQLERKRPTAWERSAATQSFPEGRAWQNSLRSDSNIRTRILHCPLAELQCRDLHLETPDRTSGCICLQDQTRRSKDARAALPCPCELHRDSPNGRPQLHGWSAN